MIEKVYIKPLFIKLKNSRLAKDVFLTFLSQVVIMLSAFLINKELSVKLGVIGYGEYSIVKKSSSVLSFIMLSGMGIAIPRYLSAYIAKKEYLRAFSTILMALKLCAIVVIIVILLAFFFKDFFSKIIINGFSSENIYYIVLLYSFSQSLLAGVLGFYRGVDKFVKFSIIQIVVQLSLVLIAIFTDKNIINLYLYWSISLLLIIVSFLMVDLLKNKHLFNSEYKKYNNKQFKELLSFGIPRLLGDFMLFSFQAFPLIYLGFIYTAKEVAFFSVGLLFITLVTPVFSFVGTALLPYVSKSIATNNLNQANSTIKKLLVMYLLMSIFLIIFLGLFMNVLIRLFFSLDYLGAMSLARLLILCILPESIYGLLRNPLDALSKTPYNTLTLFCSFIVLIIGFLIANSLLQFAYVYVVASLIRGFLTFIFWTLNKKKC